MKILTIKLGALGDIINSTSVINQIITHHNKDEVSLLTSEAYKKIYTNFDNLNVFAFERKGVLNSIKTVLWIRKNKFDRIYDLQSNDRTTIYCALSGSPFRAGNHPRYPYHVHPDTTYIGECHSFDRLNQIIESANIKPAKSLPHLPIPKAIVDKVAGWLNDHNLTEKNFCLLHAGSSPLHLDKRWPYFSELASKLSSTLNIVWVGGDDDVDINKTLSNKIGINATNAFDILGLAELGKRAKFAVTNDSAPMHILSCSTIPVIGLFGPTYARRTHALGQLENVITANSIIAKNDLDFEPQDISNISVEMVLNKLKDQNLI